MDRSAGAPVTKRSASFGLVLTLCALLLALAFTVGQSVAHGAEVALAGSLALLVIEMTRSLLRWPSELWVAQAPIIGWLLLVVFPWYTTPASNGLWKEGDSGFVSAGVPHTWGSHLLALLGLIGGSMIALVMQNRKQDSKCHVNEVSARVSFLPLWIILIVVYVGGIAATEGTLWRLGADTYAGATLSAFGFLEIIPTVLLGLVLSVLGFRRFSRQSLTKLDLFMVASTLILLIGLGSRWRVILLVLALFVVPLVTHRPERRIPVGLRLFGILSVVVLTPVISGLLVNARSEQTGLSSLAGANVLTTQELVVLRGAWSGMLGGSSYTEIPGQMLPAAVGGTSETPQALFLVRELISHTSGSSSPLWFEAWLNFGNLGVIVMSGLFAFAFVSFFGRSSRRLTPASLLLTSLGPTLPILAYQLMSRLLIIQALTTVVAIWLGALVVYLRVNWSLASSESNHDSRTNQLTKGARVV